MILHSSITIAIHNQFDDKVHRRQSPISLFFYHHSTILFSNNNILRLLPFPKKPRV